VLFRSNKKAFETLDRLRFRRGAWPSVDLSFIHRQTDNAQITDFTLRNIDEPVFRPQDNFNELRQNDFGIRADKPFSVGHHFDVSLTGSFRFVQRWGLIENAPGQHENIPQVDSKIALSRFLGPDKANLELTYTYQWIQPDVPNFPNRHRDFFGAISTYQLFRPIGIFHSSSYKNRFADRGWDFFAGFLRDNEIFVITSTTNKQPRRRDYFVGTSLRGFLWDRLDLNLRPTWFTSNIRGISLQKNAQLRADLTGLIRIVDEDREERKGIPGGQTGTHLSFIHLVGGVREDFARTGLNAFENNKWGVGIDSSFYDTHSRITFLASVRYDRERYFHLNKNADIVAASINVGF